MSRAKIIFLVLSLCVLPVMRTQAQTNADSSANKNTGELKIVVTSLDINDKALKLSYDIKNNSEDDAWFLAETGFLSLGFRFNMEVGAFIAEEGQTLMIRKSIGTEWDYMTYEPVYARYVRLSPEESQSESFFATMPFHDVSTTKQVRKQKQSPKYATHLAIELGYYTIDFLERIPKWQTSTLRVRDEEILLPCLSMFREFEHEREHVLRTVVDNLRIPYEEKQYDLPYESTKPQVRYELPDLTSFTKIEIRYQPSMLEYFFPYASQQSLMTPEEKEYLQSETIIVDNPEDIKAIDRYFSKAIAVDRGIYFRYRSYVNVACYHNDKLSMSFPIYNDYAIIDKEDSLICLAGFPSLTMMIPHIRAIDLRLQCAANLRSQWYRFRFYNLPESIRQNDPSLRSKTIYPTPSKWCDDMLRPYYPDSHTVGKWNDKPHICLSAGGGKNHYAMNPNCKPDSPPDIVLLFETKAGWNQHGGPELFTFDNHRPRGGCVLLNDGTVKFIRTKEELHKLRWK